MIEDLVNRSHQWRHWRDRWSGRVFGLGRVVARDRDRSSVLHGRDLAGQLSLWTHHIQCRKVALMSVASIETSADEVAAEINEFLATDEGKVRS